MTGGCCVWCVEADSNACPGLATVRLQARQRGEPRLPPAVVEGGTGHYEAVEIPFDPSVVSRRQLLDLFFRSIDPTDAGGQFCDRGESYRTAIFVDGPEERAVAEAAKAAAAAELGQQIVTPILDEAPFYEAEAYHQDYYLKDGLGDVILTRAGPQTKAEAYKFYRDACGRDRRVRELWGDDAPFIGG